MGGIPTEVVGSLPRPKRLQDAFAALDANPCAELAAALAAEQEAAAADSIRRLIQVGETFVTDGEQRQSSFATYPFADTIDGIGLSTCLAPDGGQLFAVFSDGHQRRLPRLFTGPFRYKRYAGEFVAKNVALSAGHPVKQAVIAPSMLSLLYPLDGHVEGYPREQFLHDLCDEAEKDIRSCFAAGAARVSVDFTEGRLACKSDATNPWTARSLLRSFVDLNNRVLDRFSPEERARIGVHTCPGGDCDSVHSAEVPYSSLLPELFRMNAGYFLIQCASEPDKEAVYRLIAEHSRADQVCFIGVVDPISPEVETAEEVESRLVAAAAHIGVKRLGATDDCGFSPFSRDLKPKHGGDPDAAREIALRKIAARIAGARMASHRLGLI